MNQHQILQVREQTGFASGEDLQKFFDSVKICPGVALSKEQKEALLKFAFDSCRAIAHNNRDVDARWQMPDHIHDCPYCEFVGMKTNPDHDEAYSVDIYVCGGKAADYRVVVRTGDEPHMCGSFPVFIKNEYSPLMEDFLGYFMLKEL